jgi:hypothetical protein
MKIKNEITAKKTLDPSAKCLIILTVKLPVEVSDFVTD